MLSSHKNEVNMKVCPQCKETKESIYFPKRKTSKDGLYCWCKECCVKKTREHARNNPDAVKATREKRREKSCAAAKEYKKKHKKRLDAQKKIHYELNKEKICEKSREYAKNITEEQKRKRSEYYKKWTLTDGAIEYRKKMSEIFSQKYIKQRKASRCVTNAVRDGRLIKSDRCTLCLSIENIEGHHPDYDKPLEVVWLCRKCHRNYHKELKKELSNGSQRTKEKDCQSQVQS